jgi:hypothetical protein
LEDANLVQLCNNGFAHNASLNRLLELRSVGLLGNNGSMECLGKALKENATLLEALDISGNGLTQEGYQWLASSLTHNKGLVTLLFQGGHRAGEEEEQVQRQACDAAASVLGLVLQENYRLTNVSYSESLWT